MNASTTPDPSASAKLLGYGGLIPFVLLAFGAWFAPADWHPYIGFALLGYGATIASFLGAIHWGLAMRDEAAQSRQSLLVLGWGVVPSLIAWIALMVGLVAGSANALFVIAALLWVCFAVDRRVYPHFNVQAWLPLRFALTLVASVCCVAGAWGMLR
ncbi:MAG: DUF3429 domain-containing protein [Pseudomonadota bacterium]